MREEIRRHLEALYIRLRYPAVVSRARAGANVISFSLWGTHTKYVHGAIANLHLQPVHFPGWECWYYVAPDVPPSVVAELEAGGATIIRKPRVEDGFLGLYWRFEAVYDARVARVIVRDCDSRLSAREAAAVNEWVASGLAFHAMRDHPYHTIPILGGMWGAVGGFMPDFEQRLAEWTAHLSTGAHRRGRYFYSDQDFLTTRVWPRVRAHHIAHTSSARFHPTDRAFAVELPEGQFVGQQFDDHDLPILI